MKKQYTLLFFISMKESNDITETVDCDEWFEVNDDGTPIIYCLNMDKDSAVGYPSSSLRKVIQNKGVLKSLDGDKGLCLTRKEPLGGHQ